MDVAAVPHRHAAVLITATCLAMLGGVSAWAFTAPETGTGVAAPGNGAFANPFPNGATTSAPAQGNGAQPPAFEYEATLPVVTDASEGPALVIVPRLSVREMFNDNIFQTEADRRYDFITLVTPGLSVGANTPRLNLSLTYAPTLLYYARTPHENWVSQELFGAGSLILVPDALFMNARVFATIAPTNGGYTGAGFGMPVTPTGEGLAGPLSLSKQNRTQVLGGAVSPYFLHQFGSYGTLRVGLNLAETYTSNTGENSAIGPSAHSSTAGMNAQFQSGGFLDRVQNTLSVEASKTSGTGSAGQSHQAFVTDRVSYVLDPRLSVFADLGAETIQYDTSPTVGINDITWGIGATLTPNPDSAITVSYGHNEGATSLQVQAHYEVTARTTVTASYTTSLGTDLQQMAAQLNQAGVNQQGNAVNLNTGAPLIVTNSLLGVQNNLYRTRTLALTSATQFDRDTIALSVQHDDRTLIAAGTAGGGSDQRDTSGTASWIHLLSELATLSGSVSYGTYTYTSNDSADLFNANAALSYRLSPTLTGTASYYFYNRSSTLAGNSMYEDLVIVGLAKRF